MATGSVTTLGIGSGLDLQNILDQLKESEKSHITTKENKKSSLQKTVSAYNSVNTQLFSMKSRALSLSLESDFLKNTVSVSDEDIVTVSANDGIAQSSHSIEVIQKAQYNSWQTDGVASASAVIYAPPESGITSPGENVTSQSETMTIMHGALENQQAIDISLDPGMTLAQVIEAVNTSDANKDADGESLVTASLGENDGQYYIRIASSSVGDSADTQVGVSGFDYAMADTTVSIATAGSTDPMYLSIAPGTTYDQMAAGINNAADNPGVTAAIIDTGAADNPFRLTLTSNATGEKNRISVQNLPMAEVTGAEGSSLNAVFTVNGAQYQRQSNENISDVISGVTLNLKKTGETTFGVQKDLDPVKESITALVKGVNELMTDINGSDTETDETDEEPNPLADSYNVKNILTSLRTMLTTHVDTGSSYTSLVDLGLSVNQDGTLDLDEAALEQAIASDPEAVQSLFIGDFDAGITGLGDVINDGISDMVNSRGIVSTEIDAAQTRMERLDKDIQTATERLDKRYETMTAQFVRLDSYISQLNNESAYMQSMIDSFNKTKNK
ncbi:MAG: flagellar filament capping protein FliD [Desulfobacteraceae bacterium]|nr:flagellar filament capping protein FliD [Desulfobacteraceae bacterium]